MFDINVLPMNLSEGRNIGNLPGLFVYTAPKNVEKNRETDVLILLLHSEGSAVQEDTLAGWSDAAALAYYTARGSFTMGISAAVKALAKRVESENKRFKFPTLFVNIAIVRGRSLMLAHLGPVHSTLIASDHVENFNDETSLPLQAGENDISYFQTELHSEDIVLLCPKVPQGWTNSAILDATGDSPMNVIRYLLDQAGGNLQAAVIQIKSGRGAVTFRTRTVITADVNPENEKRMDKPGQVHRRSSDVVSRPHVSSDTYGNYTDRSDPNKPLFRAKKSGELRELSEDGSALPEEETSAQSAADETPAEVLPSSEEVMGENAGPLEAVKRESHASAIKRPGSAPKKPAVPAKKKSKLNFRQLAVILGCGLLIPAVVAVSIFFIYSNRSKSKLHREYLNQAAEAAQVALLDTDPHNQEEKWADTLSYVNSALNYGSSPAAQELKQQAMEGLDELGNGIKVTYSYANASALAKGINLTEFAAGDQYTYALDSTSGSVIRFTASGNGMALDTSFSCTPGDYTDLNNEMKTITVGHLVDFAMLPTGSPHSFLLAAADADHNVLYCSAFAKNKAAELPLPETGKLHIDAVSYYDAGLYVMDTKNAAVWYYAYNTSEGFNTEPSNYLGTRTPYITDVVDFAVFKDYAYFVRENGNLLLCDYTGYRPACGDITEISDPNTGVQINFSLHKFSKILINRTPDTSLYLMDSHLQSILNLSAKGNFVRYIVPNRAAGDISQYGTPTGFGITGQNRILWAYKNDLYIGNMP